MINNKTIGSMKNGKLADLLETSGIRISGTIVTTDTRELRSRGGATPTASARASDAAQDLEFQE